MRANEPSERDVAIYRAVRFHEMSHRQAAAKWEVSPTRVGQILAEVEAWYRANAALAATRYNPRQELLFEFQLHTQRLDMLFAKALADCEAKELPGQNAARLIAAAARVATARFAAVGALQMMLARLSPDEKLAIEPPAGGCAPSVPAASEGGAAAASGDAVSDSVVGTCAQALPLLPATEERETHALRAQVAEPLVMPAALSRKQRKRLLERKLRGRSC